MKRIMLLLIMSLVFAGCNGGPNKTNIELIQNMMDQVSIKLQDWDPAQGDQTQMRTPPDGTVVRGKAFYKFRSDPGVVEKEVNPLAGNTAPEVMTVGRHNFDIYCAVYHGSTGAGNGSVAEKMSVKPRNLLGADALAYSDGRIYYAIIAVVS